MTSTEIQPGLRASTEILVGTRDTAHQAALNAVEDLLPPGYQTVGTRLDVSHTAATPVGMRVSAHAEVLEVDGRKLTFRVWAEDEIEAIGEGTHERIVVEVERFDRRTRAKTGSDARRC